MVETHRKMSIPETNSATVCHPPMRLKRKMRELEFAEAIKHIRNPTPKMLEIAHADLVEGKKQENIAKEHEITKSAVSQASKRLWKGFLKSKGYEEISVVLNKYRAFTVKKWAKEAVDLLNNEDASSR